MRIFSGFLAFLVLFGTASAATCPSGFDDVSTNYATTFYAKDNGVCPDGYETYTAPSTLSFSFGGMILPTEPTLCGADAHYVNGECVAYATENCPSGFYKNPENGVTFYAKNNNICPDGYEIYTHGDNLSFIFNGIIIGSEKTLCASGHYVDGVCSSYSSSGCITGYVDAGADGIVAAVDANGSCPTGYDSLWAYQSCTATTSESLCTTLCNGGMLQTTAGYCAAACSAGFTTLRTSTGLIFTTYGTRTTTPSIVVANEAGTQCYVNLAPGSTTNAIHVRYNDTVYHTTN